MTRWALAGVAALAVATSVQGSAQAQQQSPVERGNYLVNSILTCGNCHTPRGPGEVVGRLGRGRFVHEVAGEAHRLADPDPSGDRGAQDALS